MLTTGGFLLIIPNGVADFYNNFWPGNFAVLHTLLGQRFALPQPPKLILKLLQLKNPTEAESQGRVR